MVCYITINLLPYQALFARTFGGTSSQVASSMAQTTDGGYAVTGATKSFGAGNWDFLLFKLNSSGNLEWAKTFGGTYDDYPGFSILQAADGGYAVAGNTASFSASNWDLLVLKLGPEGDYPGCVAECSPTIGTPNLSTSSPSVGENCSLTVTTQTLTVTDACPPAVEENDILAGNRLTCSPFSSGVLFNSPADLSIKIYTVDGRVAYSGQLQNGENRITLRHGVYLWQAGTRSGKAAVR